MTLHGEQQTITEKDKRRYQAVFTLYSDCGLGLPSVRNVADRTGLNRYSIRKLVKEFGLKPYDL